MRVLAAIICSLLLATAVAAAPPRLHVVGNTLQSEKGRTVRLQGVNIASLEWSNTGDTQLMQSVQVALQDWNAGIIRLPLCQDRWLGKADGQTDGGSQYRQIVTDVVNAIAARQKYVLLDLHWSDAGQWGRNIAQHSMPDDDSTVFWKSLAPCFADNPAVLFDLYNEPRGVTWDVWQHGGFVIEHNTNRDRETTLEYHSPGMQGLLNTIRAAGAKNVVVAGGLDWAYDLTGIVGGHALIDPDGRGILYATHIYPWKKDWDAHVTVAAAKYPIFVGEVGCEPSRPGAPAYTHQEDPAAWAPKVIAYINQHHFSWTAWCFHPSASPCLLADWNYTPTSYWGVPVKNALTSANPTATTRVTPRLPASGPSAQ